jgi:hypothetical protein
LHILSLSVALSRFTLSLYPTARCDATSRRSTFVHSDITGYVCTSRSSQQTIRQLLTSSYGTCDGQRRDKGRQRPGNGVAVSISCLSECMYTPSSARVPRVRRNHRMKPQVPFPWTTGAGSEPLDVARCTERVSSACIVTCLSVSAATTSDGSHVRRAPRRGCQIRASAGCIAQNARLRTAESESTRASDKRPNVAPETGLHRPAWLRRPMVLGPRRESVAVVVGADYTVGREVGARP